MKLLVECAHTLKDTKSIMIALRDANINFWPCAQPQANCLPLAVRIVDVLDENKWLGWQTTSVKSDVDHLEL